MYTKFCCSQNLIIQTNYMTNETKTVTAQISKRRKMIVNILKETITKEIHVIEAFILISLYIMNNEYA